MQDPNLSLGDVLQSLGPIGWLISPLFLLLIVAGILVVVLARTTLPIKLYLAAALLPLLCGLVASQTAGEYRREVAARSEAVTEQDLEGLPVTMGAISSVPCLALGFFGLWWKGRRRGRRRARAESHLGG